MAILLPSGKFSSETLTGTPLVGGKVYAYVPNTSTPKDTYTTVAESVQNPHPVILDARGEATIYWSGSYDVILKDANGATIWGPERLQETGSADDLETRLADPTSASNGDAMVGHSDALTYTPGPRVSNYLRSYTTPLAYTGCDGTGVLEDTAYVNAALASGKKEVIIPGGHTFLVDGNLLVPSSGMRIRGEGKIIKKAGNVKPIFLLADSIQDTLFEGFTIDGAKASFSSGDAVPAILGHLAQWVKIHHMNFQNIIDVGVKLRNCAYLEFIGGKLLNIGQNGIEIDNYDVDVRTGSPYIASLPPLQGGHRIEGAWFGQIDDGNHGAGDGCGIRVSTVLVAAGAPYPIKGVGIVNNDFVQCLRGIWVENNDVGTETEDVQAIANRIRGDVSAYGGETYQGIGVIGILRAIISNNTITNIGNFNPSSDTNNGILVSASFSTSQYVKIRDNTIVENTGGAFGMEHSIKLTAGSNIDVQRNTLVGATVSAINVNSAAVSELRCSDNPGAQGSYSWGETTSLQFDVTDIPGTATTPMRPYGNADDAEITLPMPARAVGLSVKRSATLTAGTMTFNVYTNGTLRANLTIVNADFTANVAVKEIAVGSGVTIPAGSRIRIDCVTAGFTPITCDANAILILDTEIKE